MKNTNTLIKLENVTKIINDKRIIDDLSLEIYAGSSVCLLAPNGAGKSTLIKMILGLDEATSGKIFLNGLPSESPLSRLQVGMALQESDFIEELTVRETIEFACLHYPDPLPFDQIIADFSLQKCVDKLTIALSSGQKKCLTLALAFAGQPKIVILDEPTTDLDLRARSYFWKYIKSFQKADTTILMTTHYVQEAQTLADRIILLNNGNILIDGSYNFIIETAIPVGDRPIEELFLDLTRG